MRRLRSLREMGISLNCLMLLAQLLTLAFTSMNLYVFLVPEAISSVSFWSGAEILRAVASFG